MQSDCVSVFGGLILTLAAYSERGKKNKVFLVSTLHKKLNNVPCNLTQNDGALEKSTSLPPASFST